MEGSHEQLTQQYRTLYDGTNVEYVEHYRPGGYHPVNLHDILNSRFEVIAKLGHGGISTVWLCYGLKTRKWHAIKINAASESTDDCADLKVLELFRQKSVSHATLKKNHICIATETFWVEGPNGRHLCSVLPILGPTLMDWCRRLSKVRDTKRKKAVGYQLVQAIAFLEKHGIAHADFRTQNVLMSLREGALDRISKLDMIKRYEHQTKERIVLCRGGPRVHAPEFAIHAYGAQQWEDMVLDAPVVVDFGEAFTASNPPKRLGIPQQYAAPEVLFNDKLGPGVDIWSLGMALIEICSGCELDGGTLSALWHMERFAGPVPEKYRELGKRLIVENDGEARDTELVQDSGDQGPPTRSAITAAFEEFAEEAEEEAEGTGLIDPIAMKLVTQTQEPEGEPNPDTGELSYVWTRMDIAEAVLLADLLRGMFEYDAATRLKPSEALNHAWFGGLTPKRWLSRFEDQFQGMVQNCAGAARKRLGWMGICSVVLIFMLVSSSLLLNTSSYHCKKGDYLVTLRLKDN